jgi:hypothetical protein
MRNRIFVRPRDRLRARPLFRDESALSARLMRPSLLTRASDRIVEFFSRFSADKPRPDLINTDPSQWRSPIRALLGTCFLVFVFSRVGNPENAVLFFGAQAGLLIGLKAWFDWHRKNPPLKNASSTLGGVGRALLHAAAAFIAGAAYIYAITQSIPSRGLPRDWIDGIDMLIIPSGLAILTYQRRTAWDHDDPEIGVLIGALALVAYVGLMLARAVFF